MILNGSNPLPIRANLLRVVAAGLLNVRAASEPGGRSSASSFPVFVVTCAGIGKIRFPEEVSCLSSCSSKQSKKVCGLSGEEDVDVDLSAPKTKGFVPGWL